MAANVVISTTNAKPPSIAKAVESSREAARPAGRQLLQDRLQFVGQLDRRLEALFGPFRQQPWHDFVHLRRDVQRSPR